MKKQIKSRSKIVKKVLLTLAVLPVLIFTAFFLWASDYYHAENAALAVMQNSDTITVWNHMTIVAPSVPSDTAFIFYPGAKVEAAAYLPILEKIKTACGITCILVEMPFNMAIFDVNAAESVMEEFPAIENWYIGGHSMGEQWQVISHRNIKMKSRD